MICVASTPIERAPTSPSPLRTLPPAFALALASPAFTLPTTAPVLTVRRRRVKGAGAIGGTGKTDDGLTMRRPLKPAAAAEPTAEARSLKEVGDAVDPTILPGALPIDAGDVHLVKDGFGKTVKCDGAPEVSAAAARGGMPGAEEGALSELATSATRSSTRRGGSEDAASRGGGRLQHIAHASLSALARRGAPSRARRGDLRAGTRTPRRPAPAASPIAARALPSPTSHPKGVGSARPTTLDLLSVGSE